MAIEREIKIMKGYADRGIIFVNPRNKMEKREVNTFTSIQEDTARTKRSGQIVKVACDKIDRIILD